MGDQDRWARMLDAVAGAEPARAAFGVAEAFTREAVGAGLFTVTAHDPGARECWRLYTSNAEAYPLLGRKPIERDAWFRTVLEQRQPFVANSVAEFAPLFPDHAFIRSLGLEAVINVPVTVAGAVRGTVNILDVAGHYTPERVAAIMALRPFYTVAMLAALAGERAG